MKNSVFIFNFLIGCTTSAIDAHVENVVLNGKDYLKAPVAIQDEELFNLRTEQEMTPDDWWKIQFNGKDPKSLTSDWVNFNKGFVI